MEFEEIKKTLDKAWQESGQEPVLPQSGTPNRGQVRLTRGGSADLSVREVLILRTDEEGYSDVLLTHPFTESATDVDLTIAQSAAEIPYDLVIRQLPGIVWTDDYKKSLDFSTMKDASTSGCEQRRISSWGGYGRGLKLRIL